MDRQEALHWKVERCAGIRGTTCMPLSVEKGLAFYWHQENGYSKEEALGMKKIIDNCQSKSNLHCFVPCCTCVLSMSSWSIAILYSCCTIIAGCLTLSMLHCKLVIFLFCTEVLQNVLFQTRALCHRPRFLRFFFVRILMIELLCSHL